MRILRRYVAAGCFGLSLGIGAGRIVYDRPIDGTFVLAFVLAFVGVAIIPWED